MKDVLGQALSDYYADNTKHKLWIHNTYGRKEEMPVEVYFRQPEEMPLLELRAIEECKGKVLDIGAGAGSHALLLQQKGFLVTALDISEKAVAVMKDRGVKKAVQGDIMQFEGEKFDTLLLLMNGIGLTGTIQGLRIFLSHAKDLLNIGGQLLFDSSDVAYLYKNKPLPGKNYYGEISFQYEYKKQITDWFTWLYIDQKTLRKIAIAEGWQMQVLFVDEMDQYLVKLEPIK
jgi:SAM-dependent methyltransferase